MSKSIYLLCILVFLACSKEDALNNSDTLNQIETENTEYYLDFEIRDSVYNGSPTFANISSIQDLSYELIFKDAYSSKFKYPYFSNDATPEDSVHIVGSVRFNINTNSELEFNEVDLDFFLSESIHNLELTDDGSYRYLDNWVLYQKLVNHDFGNRNMFNSSDIHQLFMTLPSEVKETDHSFYAQTTSNGFYFDYEQLDLTDILWLEREQSIILVGSFDVDLKGLSCGFYSFYAVRNAQFKLLIK